MNNFWGINIENNVLFENRAPNQNKSPFWIFFFMFQNERKIFINENDCAFLILWVGGEVDFAYPVSLEFQIALFPGEVLYPIFIGYSTYVKILC